MKRWIALVAALAPLSALAAYPERPVRLVVPWAAGGDTDNIFRPFAPLLQKHLGQTVVIANVGGASGTRGARPSYDTYLNFTPVAFSISAGKKWLVEASVAPTVIWPGRALASAARSFQLFHGVFGLAVSTDAVELIRQIGSKSLYCTSATPAQ